MPRLLVLGRSGADGHISFTGYHVNNPRFKVYATHQCLFSCTCSQFSLLQVNIWHVTCNMLLDPYRTGQIIPIPWFTPSPSNDWSNPDSHPHSLIPTLIHTFSFLLFFRPPFSKAPEGNGIGATGSKNPSAYQNPYFSLLGMVLRTWVWF